MSRNGIKPKKFKRPEFEPAYCQNPKPLEFDMQDIISKSAENFKHLLLVAAEKQAKDKVVCEVSVKNSDTVLPCKLAQELTKEPAQEPAQEPAKERETVQIHVKNVQSRFGGERPEFEPSDKLAQECHIFDKVVPEVKSRFSGERPEFEPSDTLSQGCDIGDFDNIKSKMIATAVISRFGGERPSFEPGNTNDTKEIMEELDYSHMAMASQLNSFGIGFASKCECCKKTIYHEDCDECHRGICFQCDLKISVEIEAKLKTQPPNPACLHCLGCTKYEDLCEKHKSLLFEMRNKLIRTQPEALYAKYKTYKPTLQQVLDKNFVEAGQKICLGCGKCLCQSHAREEVYKSKNIQDLVIVHWDDVDGRRFCSRCYTYRFFAPGTAVINLGPAPRNCDMHPVTSGDWMIHDID
jgi:hypothetical protein